MASIIHQRFHQWTEGKDAIDARITIYEKIRDIPYAILPELIHHERYANILHLGRGSCTPKHFLLSWMYERLGLMVLYAVYPFHWHDIGVDYPPKLKRMAQMLPASNHLACKVEIEGRLVLVDATVDVCLEPLGLPANKGWNGVKDTILPIDPAGECQLYHPCEAASVMDVAIDDTHLAFYDELNSWLDEMRKTQLLLQEK